MFMFDSIHGQRSFSTKSNSPMGPKEIAALEKAIRKYTKDQFVLLTIGVPSEERSAQYDWTLTATIMDEVFAIAMKIKADLQLKYLDKRAKEEAERRKSQGTEQ